MARIFVKDPESGRVAVEVKSYMAIERDELQQAVDVATQSVVEVDSELEANRQLETELVDKKAALERQLESAKSELSGYDSAPEAERGLDDGSDGAGSYETPSVEEAVAGPSF